MLDKTVLPNWQHPDRNIWPPLNSFASDFASTMVVAQRPGAAWSVRIFIRSVVAPNSLPKTSGWRCMRKRRQNNNSRARTKNSKPSSRRVKMAGHETQVKEGIPRRSLSGRRGQVTRSVTSAARAAAISGFLLRLARNQGGSFMAPGGQVVSVRNNLDSPWPLSGGVTDKTMVPLAENPSPK